MLPKIYRGIRWLTFVCSGLIVFQTAAGCDPALQVAQTGLLAGITGILYYLARNV